MFDPLSYATCLFEIKTSEINPAKAQGIQPKKSPEQAGGLMFRLGLGSKGSAITPVRNVPNVRYADIAGQEAALEQLKNVVELPLTHQAYFEALRVAPQPRPQLPFATIMSSPFTPSRNSRGCRTW